MTRAEAVELFGGQQALADAIGVDRSRISQWPAKGRLPQRDADRVVGAAVRKGLLTVRKGNQSIVIS